MVIFSYLRRRFLILMIFFGMTITTGCPFENCSKYFTLSGTVSDVDGLGISDVEVIYVDPEGKTKKIAETDGSGLYSYVWGPSVDLRTSYLRFQKGGFVTNSTSDLPIGDGGGSCSDQSIIRNVVLEQE